MPVPETRGEYETLRPSPPLAALLWTECPNRWTRRVRWEVDEKTRLAHVSLQGHDISYQATNCLAISVSAGRRFDERGLSEESLVGFSPSLLECGQLNEWRRGWRS